MEEYHIISVILLRKPLLNLITLQLFIDICGNLDVIYDVFTCLDRDVFIFIYLFMMKEKLLIN